MQAVCGGLPERSLHERHIDPGLCLVAVGQKGLQAVYSCQAYFGERMP